MNSCASFFTLHSELQKQKAWVEAVCLQHCSNVKLCVTDDPAWITQVACVLWCCHGVTAVLGPLPCHSFSKTNVGNGEMTEIDLFLVHLYQNYLTSKIQWKVQLLSYWRPRRRHHPGLSIGARSPFPWRYKQWMSQRGSAGSYALVSESYGPFESRALSILIHREIKAKCFVNEGVTGTPHSLF